jgi:X-linked retinitis pigmentosa GTPase regulator
MPKVDEIDLNGNSVADTTGQVEKTEVKDEETKVETKVEETKVETEESVDTLKERLKKSEEEKENYKRGMLKYKDLTLKKPEEEEKENEEEYPEWDENSKKFQEQTLSQAEKKAEERAKSIVEKYNEKSAIAQFVTKNPELAEEDKWNEVISNYHPKNGKETKEDILKDLERALVITKYEKGELTNLESSAFNKGKEEGKAEVTVANMSSVSKTTQKTTKESNVLSNDALMFAEKMRVDPKKLAEEDDSLTAEIKF